MRLKNYLTCIVVLICLPLAGFAQNQDSKTESNSGLKKIGGGRSPRIDIHIDQAKLEADIEAAVETALKSVEHSLEGLHINIEPIEISLGSLEALDALEPLGSLEALDALEPLAIIIPELDINIEPIEIELDELEMGIDENVWNDEDDEDESDDEDQAINTINVKDKYKEETKEIKADKAKAAKEKKNKSKGKSDKERAKGLKKVE